MSYTESLGMDTLIGRKVLSAQINDANDLVVLDTDKGILYLTWVGDCCARCFLANVSGADALVGTTIKSAENTEWTGRNDNDEYGDVVESMGTTIKTNKGTVTFESRVEHNGYYGGYINISDKGPLGQYGDLETMPDAVLKNLENF